MLLHKRAKAAALAKEEQARRRREQPDTHAAHPWARRIEALAHALIVRHRREANRAAKAEAVRKSGVHPIERTAGEHNLRLAARMIEPMAEALTGPQRRHREAANAAPRKDYLLIRAAWCAHQEV